LVYPTWNGHSCPFWQKTDRNACPTGQRAVAARLKGLMLIPSGAGAGHRLGATCRLDLPATWPTPAPLWPGGLFSEESCGCAFAPWRTSDPANRQWLTGALQGRRWIPHSQRQWPPLPELPHMPYRRRAGQEAHSQALAGGDEGCEWKGADRRGACGDGCGKAWASGSTDRTIKLWDVAMARKLVAARFTVLSRKDLDRRWHTLGRANAAKPYRAINTHHGTPPSCSLARAMVAACHGAGYPKARRLHPRLRQHTVRRPPERQRGVRGGGRISRTGSAEQAGGDAIPRSAAADRAVLDQD